MELVAEVTGGAYSSPWLDGENADLHRVCVWAKACEEIAEAHKKLSETDLISSPYRSGETRRQEVWESLLEALDARVAIDHYVAVVCETFGFSVSELYREHRKKLENLGYVQPRPKRKNCYEISLP